VSDSGSHANLWVMDLSTGQSRQITYETDPDLRVGLSLWSPDGSQIAYFMSRGASWNYFLIRPDGSQPRLLAQNAGWAAWSADGRWLYFSRVSRLLERVYGMDAERFWQARHRRPSRRSASRPRPQERVRDVDHVNLGRERQEYQEHEISGVMPLPTSTTASANRKMTGSNTDVTHCTGGTCLHQSLKRLCSEPW
jgi:hypothetical protein